MDPKLYVFQYISLRIGTHRIWTRLKTVIGKKERRNLNYQLQVCVAPSNINCNISSVEIELNQIKALDGQKKRNPTMGLPHFGRKKRKKVKKTQKYKQIHRKRRKSKILFDARQKERDE